MEDQADKIMGEDDDESSENNDDQTKTDDEDDSFIQLRKHTKARNIDDDNAQAAEMARLEDQSDKIMGEDDGESSENNEDQNKSDDEDDSFIQLREHMKARNIDDDNAQAAEMARMEDQADKIMGEDDDESSENNDDQNK